MDEFGAVPAYGHLGLRLFAHGPIERHDAVLIVDQEHAERQCIQQP
jgi:hypothetical protein